MVNPMRRNQAQHEPSSRDRDLDDKNNDNDDDDDDDGDDVTTNVSHRHSRLPPREADEEEVAEDDIMEQLDEDDAAKAEGPDA